MSPTSQRRLLKILLNISACIFFYHTKFYWVLGISTIALLWRFTVLYFEFRTERNLRAQIKGFQIPTKRYSVSKCDTAEHTNLYLKEFKIRN